MKTQRNILIITGILAFIAVLAVNTLASTLPINNKTTGELSDNLPNLFVPAGLTFSIWGIIYLLLLVFVVYQAIPLFKKGDDTSTGMNRIRLLFVFSCLVNVSWIFAWHYEQILLSAIIMLLFLGILIGIYLTLRNAMQKGKFTWIEHTCIALPFSVYLGWITVATVANITALLVAVKWNGWGIPDYIWTVIVIAAVLVIGLLMLFRNRDYPYTLVLIWALAGILIKRTNPSFPAQPAIVIAAIVSILCLLAGCVVVLLKKATK